MLSAGSKQRTNELLLHGNVNPAGLGEILSEYYRGFSCLQRETRLYDVVDMGREGLPLIITKMLS